MKIVALDTFPINPGDLRWDPVTTLGTSTLHDRTSPDEVYDRVKDADIVLTNKVQLTGEMMTRLPQLKYIGVMATGYNIVDIQAAREQGICVSNVPSYSTNSVAQLVFALLLELTHHAAAHSVRVHEGAWAECRDFNFRIAPLIELAGRTMGIIGYGEIGKTVARIATAFGMNVIVATRTPFASTASIRCMEMDAVFSQSDVLSIHCPLTPETSGLVNEHRLAVMKPTAFIINTSRGPIVDEQALADVLNADRIAGAGIDVLSTEPPRPENPLLTAKNCIITPHVGWATFAARERLVSVIASNIAAFISGAPQNVVS